LVLVRNSWQSFAIDKHIILILSLDNDINSKSLDACCTVAKDMFFGFGVLLASTAQHISVH